MLFNQRRYIPTIMNVSSGKEGSSVQITTKENIFTGTLLPSQNKNTVVVKLGNGYNVGIDKNKITKIKILKKSEQIKTKIKKFSQNSKLPKISILSVGGTISSKVDYSTGAVIAKITPGELLKDIPELTKLANISYEEVMQIMSESMRFSHYNHIAKEVQKELKKSPQGIIITHGTDTLHYTSAALAFMLENPSIPILLVGSQRSSDRGSSDAKSNLLNAVKFILEANFKGVALCMHASSSDDECLILPPTKTRKLHTSRRDAFKPVNDSEIARVSFAKNKVDIIKSSPVQNEKFQLKMFKENIKVGLLKGHTNLFPENISCFKGYKGLILEGTGLGGFPTNEFDSLSKINTKNKKELKKLIDSGTIVVMTSQCLFGRVNMNVYSPGRELLNLGVFPGQDMLPETAFIKLAFLLSNYPKKQVQELMQKNMVGEINSRILPDQYFEEKERKKT